MAFDRKDYGMNTRRGVKATCEHNSWRPRKSRTLPGRARNEAGDVGAISVIVLLAFIPGWIQKWLWMRQLGYTGVFWTLLSVRWELFCAAFVVALLYLWINLRLAARNGATFRAGNLTSESTVAANSASRSLPRF
jgi:hypothetical protein